MVNKMPLAPILIIQYFNQTRAKQITLYVNPLDDNKKDELSETRYGRLERVSLQDL